MSYVIELVGRQVTGRDGDHGIRAYKPNVRGHLFTADGRPRVYQRREERTAVCCVQGSCHLVEGCHGVGRDLWAGQDTTGHR